MRYKHGDLIALIWPDEEGDEPSFIRGHVTEQEARTALRGRADDSDSLTLRHIYGRWVFSQCEDFDRELRTYSEPQRGAFALTEVLHNA